MRQVGPHICVLKTHVDLHTDFSEHFVSQLQALAEKHGGCLSLLMLAHLCAQCLEHRHKPGLKLDGTFGLRCCRNPATVDLVQRCPTHQQRSDEVAHGWVQPMAASVQTS